MPSVCVLLQVFIGANVTRIFDDTSTLSEHERTRAVQKVVFKFFTELYDIVLPKTANRSAEPTTTTAVRLQALATMTELICQRNIFVRSDHDLGLDHKMVIQAMMERVNAISSTPSTATTATTATPSKRKKRKHSKVDSSGSSGHGNGNAVAAPCLKLISLCLQMDHNFWKRFVHVWSPLLHQWDTYPSECVNVFVTAIQSFAKVRQLDVYTELLCSVSKKESLDVNMSLVCENTFQRAAQDAVAQCPAGQVQVLWNILETELTSR